MAEGILAVYRSADLYYQMTHKASTCSGGFSLLLLGPLLVAESNGLLASVEVECATGGGLRPNKLVGHVVEERLGERLFGIHLLQGIVLRTPELLEHVEAVDSCARPGVPGTGADGDRSPADPAVVLGHPLHHGFEHDLHLGHPAIVRLVGVRVEGQRSGRPTLGVESRLDLTHHLLEAECGDLDRVQDDLRIGVHRLVEVTETGRVHHGDGMKEAIDVLALVEERLDPLQQALGRVLGNEVVAVLARRVVEDDPTELLPQISGELVDQPLNPSLATFRRIDGQDDAGHRPVQSRVDGDSPGQAVLVGNAGDEQHLLGGVSLGAEGEQLFEPFVGHDDLFLSFW